MQSLRDKLLKAGLVSEDAAKKSEADAKAKSEAKARPPPRHDGPRHEGHRSDGPPRDGSRRPSGGAPSGHSFRPEKSDSRIPRLAPMAGTAAANRATSRAQLENDRKLRERVLAAQVALEPGATTFHFVTRKNKLRRLELSEAQAKALQDGVLAVVERPDPDKIEHALVPAEVAKELKALSDKVVRFLNQPGEAVGFLSEEELLARAEAEAREAASATTTTPEGAPATPPAEGNASGAPLITIRRAPLASAPAASLDLPLTPSSRLLVTGGTGFVGRSLLRWLADPAHGLDALRPTVLTRNARAFRARWPDLAARVDLLEGDVRSFAPPAGPFTHVVHAAMETHASAHAADRSAELRATIVEGTRHALEVATAVGAKRFLYLSSGAAYGPQPADRASLPEDFEAPLDAAVAANTHGLGKREAEALCAAWSSGGRVACSARLFAFLGPDLPLDQHFAIGNFLRDALAGRPIEVKGDGTPLRTYLDASDLSEWLVTLLGRGAPGRVYNVGSDEVVDMAGLARLVAEVVAPGLEVRIANARRDDAARHRYVPAITRARDELGLTVKVPLRECILRAAAWHRAHPDGR